MTDALLRGPAHTPDCVSSHTLTERPASSSSFIDLTGDDDDDLAPRPYRFKPVGASSPDNVNERVSAKRQYQDDHSAESPLAKRRARTSGPAERPAQVIDVDNVIDVDSAEEEGRRSRHRVDDDVPSDAVKHDTSGEFPPRTADSQLIKSDASYSSPRSGDSEGLPLPLSTVDLIRNGFGSSTSLVTHLSNSLQKRLSRLYDALNNPAVSKTPARLQLRRDLSTAMSLLKSKGYASQSNGYLPYLRQVASPGNLALLKETPVLTLFERCIRAIEPSHRVFQEPLPIHEQVSLEFFGGLLTHRKQNPDATDFSQRLAHSITFQEIQAGVQEIHKSHAIRARFSNWVSTSTTKEALECIWQYMPALVKAARLDDLASTLELQAQTRMQPPTPLTAPGTLAHRLGATAVGDALRMFCASVVGRVRQTVANLSLTRLNLLDGTAESDRLTVLARLLQEQRTADTANYIQTHQPAYRPRDMPSEHLDAEQLEELMQDIAGHGDLKGTEDEVQKAARELELDSVPGPLRRFAMEEMKCTLMPHQVLGVEWMVRREAPRLENGRVNQVRGGLLADVMGLGKTVQCVATMARNMPPLDNRMPTLIICPVALIHQWEQEIRSKARSGSSTKINIYHNASKARSSRKLREHDVVITSYGTMAREWPIKKHKTRLTDEQKAEEQARCERDKGPLFEVKWFRVILDEAHQIKNGASNASIAASMLDYERIWCLSGTPIQNGVDDTYPIFRMLKVPILKDKAAFREKIGNNRAGSGLRALTASLSPYLLRRNKNDQIAGKPILELPEKHVQMIELELPSRERNIYAAIEDRARENLNELLRKNLATKSWSNILTMLLRLRQACIHALLTSDAWKPEDEDETIEMTLERIEQLAAGSMDFGDADGAKAEDGAVLCAACGAEAQDPQFAPNCGHVFCMSCVDDVLEEPEAPCRGCGERVGQICKYDPKRHVIRSIATGGMDEKVAAPGTSKVEYNDRNDASRQASIFHSIDISDTESDDSFDEAFPPMPVPATVTGLKPESSTVKGERLNGDDEAAETNGRANHDTKNGIKDESAAASNATSTAVSEAGDVKPSVNAYTRMMQMSRRDDVNLGRRLADNEIAWGRLAKTQWPNSEKLKRVMDLLTEIQVESEDKILVFSTFVKALDLLAVLLSRAGTSFLRYQGDMSLADREKTLKKFCRPSGPKILLMSLKAGGVGLNLVAANRVVLLDFWWNAAAEHQAIDRAHRIGQEKEVHVYRIAIKGTIEQRILALQEEKLRVAGHVLGEGEGGKLGKLSMRDVMSLFGRVVYDEQGRQQIERAD